MVSKPYLIATLYRKCIWFTSFSQTYDKPGRADARLRTMRKISPAISPLHTYSPPSRVGHAYARQEHCGSKRTRVPPLPSFPLPSALSRADARQRTVDPGIPALSLYQPLSTSRNSRDHEIISDLCFKSHEVCGGVTAARKKTNSNSISLFSPQLLFRGKTEELEFKTRSPLGYQEEFFSYRRRWNMFLDQCSQ